jgi:alpha/beta superfamily hydrolase
MVTGTEDEIIPEGAVDALVKKLSMQKGITIKHEVVKGANHYFNDRLDELTGIVDGYLTETMQPREPVRMKQKRA